jgi:hypothetical protein
LTALSRRQMNSLTTSGCVTESNWPAPVTTTSGRVCLTRNVRSADPWIWKTCTPLVLALGCQVRAAQLAQRKNVDWGLERRFSRPTTTLDQKGARESTLWFWQRTARLTRDGAAPRRAGWTLASSGPFARA